MEKSVWENTPHPFATCKACTGEIGPQFLRSLYILRCELAGAREAYARTSERLGKAEARITQLMEAQKELEMALVRR